MGAGLVGDDVDRDPAPQQLGEHLGAVADHADRPGASLGSWPAAPSPRRNRGRRRPRPGSGAATRRSSRVRSTSTIRQTPSLRVTASGCAPPMPPQPPVSVNVPARRAAEPLLGDGGERLVRALDDALGADVDPRAGGHLAVHGEARALQPAELGPVRPVRHQVGVGDQHPRRPLVGPHHPDRAAGLDQHGLVGLQVASACGPWRRTSASRVPPGRCRRTRRGRRVVRRSPDRGCSSASAAGPRWPRTWRSGCCRAVRGRVGRLP